MEAETSETLKKQFQLLQEQQQKKLQRRKQKKEEKSKEKSIVNTSNAFGVDDDLNLKLADPVPKGSGYISEELVQHLNNQIREVKDENGRLYRLLSEKDFEIRNLKKKREEDEAAGGKVTNEAAATKIVELSKKVRELTAELQSEKTKVKQYGKKCMELQNQISNIPEETRSMLGSAVSLNSQMDEKKENEVDVKGLQDKLRHTENKMSEYRIQCSTLKNEIKMAQKVLQQEIGTENISIQSLMNQQSSWRGRAQQIISLQQKVEELKGKLENSKPKEYDLEREMLGNSSARKRTGDDRHREQLRKIDKEKKEAQERAANEFKALESDHENLKKKLDAAKSRNSVLSKEIKSFKQQMQTMVQKGQHDDELIEALMLQQAQLQKMLEQTSETKTLTEVDSREKVKQMEMKKQHDNNIVQQLKIIVAEKETKVHALEDEIKQLKLNHLQKAQMENANMLFQPSNRPQSTNENVELEFRLSSVTPTDSRMSDRPPTVNSMLESARSQSRKSLVRESSFTVNNLDKRAVNELTYQCQEYKTLMQVADVEREKLSELVQVLQKRSDESTQKVADVQNELINQRKKNALLEKQIGKSKIEQSSKCKGDGLPSRSKKRPGRASSVNVASSIRDSAVFGEMDEDDLPQNMNLEELVTTLEIQKDEIDSLKGTLKNTLKAKEEDLRMYSQMMEETKTVFLQALKQFKENDQGT
ncbi:coiled-coil domain-containing protein 13-like [Mytilus californianus]|uniref:coiled-coil domain-containing protein 13-like n=1 Tax=Mytilus californianus TaxID=6549 RepID=UPI0022456900|nr:coiled-coil domain-containing protein 13-like [Mytilus californianus]XP_052092264.1 coiled-coil domain-containing protein 13-like [Mytilus californianus]XP_052092265.1 coiled-coil domain-containing protein 13-like [Mytilus californianus]XP_052092266.1 coiled-coil domain-containing protein 13-like [Mytilus californianus]